MLIAGRTNCKPLPRGHDPVKQCTGLHRVCAKDAARRRCVIWFGLKQGGGQRVVPPGRWLSEGGLSLWGRPQISPHNATGSTFPSGIRCLSRWLPVEDRVAYKCLIVSALKEEWPRQPQLQSDTCRVKGTCHLHGNRQPLLLCLWGDALNCMKINPNCFHSHPLFLSLLVNISILPVIQLHCF